MTRFWGGGKPSCAQNYFLLCTQGSPLVVHWRPYMGLGIEAGLTACKINVLPVLSLRPSTRYF